MSPVDLPLLENPRYDFFLTLLGVFMNVSSFYYIFISPINIPEIKLLLTLPMGLGYIIFINGINQMADRHKIENKIFIINSFTQRKNMITQLRKENLIEAAEETSLNVYLRDEILNYIEKHKK
ncbi:hypothetical protein HZC31_07310 [Candidatus Woesearchaeota archaeon]|nr:hypothetical protein [Candidatus Woesearchaeota archaeon]